MADSTKLEVEIIDSGDGGSSSLSPEDFASVREFNKALARLKAAARAKEFEENQEIKAKRQILKQEKMTADEVKAGKKKEIDQTRLTVQEMKAKRQLDVVIAQNERSREAEINKRDRHREMMLRHVLGAVNPNSTFQYRMSSIYGLLNTAGITSERDVNRIPGQGEGVFNEVKSVMSTLTDGLKNLFGGLRQSPVKTVAQSTIKNITTGAATGTSQPSQAVSPPEEDMPWWWNTKPKGFRPTDFDKLRSINQMTSGGYQPLGIKSNVPALQPANIKMATPVGVGGAGGIGGGGLPPIGGSPAGAAGGGGGGGLLASGLKFVSSNLLTIGIAAGIAVGVFGGLILAARYLTNRFNNAIDAIRNWSGALIASGITSQMRMMNFSMERANKYGGSLASFEQSQTTLEISMTRLGDSLTMAFIPILNGFTNILSAVANDVSSGLDYLGRMLNSIGINETNFDKLLNFLYNIGSPLYDFLKWFKNEKTVFGGESAVSAALANFLNAPPAFLGSNFDPATPMRPVAFSFNMTTN